ncbi:MAG: membrane protein insertase YidC [Gammaproteobacteria bacterium]
MDSRRLFLLLALGLILLLLWTAWRSEHPTASPAQNSSVSTAASSQASGTTTAPATVSSEASGAAPAAVPSGRIENLTPPHGPDITIRTDVLELTVALKGAALIRATLLKYPQERGQAERVTLLSPAPNDFLVAYPELNGAGIPGEPVYSTTASTYTLAPGASSLRVPLAWSGNGLKLTQTLVLTHGSYALKILTRASNTGTASIGLTSGVRIVGRDPLTSQHFWDHFLPKYWAYRGPAFYDGSYNKSAAESLAESPIFQSFGGGWIASVNQYFVAAAIPPAAMKPTYFGQPAGADGYDIGYRLPAVAVPAGAHATTTATLFLGPKLQGSLEQVAPGLSRTVDYGKATIICVPIFWILSHIHAFVGNWGWSLILLVLLIKALFYFPQRMSARSMAKMRKLQPRIKHLQERYKDDKQKLSQATMELYRKEGANPVSGCLPMLIQIPIFIGLFYVLDYSVELRQAPWVLWIQDLSAPDPLYVLPILYGIASLLQFRLQPQATDNAQAKLMMFMPLIFTFFYAIFPSGLVLYYLLNTMLNVAIQWQVNRELGIPLNLWPKRKKVDG